MYAPVSPIGSVNDGLVWEPGLLSGRQEEARVVKLQPVAGGSLLLASYLQLLYTPRVLRLGLAQSLLAARLRRSGLYPYYCAGPTPHCSAAHLQPQPSPIKAPMVEPVERFWPSDLEDQEARITVESADARGIELPVGASLDVWM